MDSINKQCLQNRNSLKGGLLQDEVSSRELKFYNLLKKISGTN